MGEPRKGLVIESSDEEDSANESAVDTEENLKGRGSRQAAQQASNAITKTIFKQGRTSEQEESSGSESNEDSFDSFDLKLRKRELVVNEQHQSKKQRDQESSTKVT